MNKFHFGLGSGKVSKQEEKRINRILNNGNYGVDFFAISAIGIGTRYWFSGPNRGHPFDQKLANKVLSAIGTVKTI